MEEYMTRMCLFVEQKDIKALKKVSEETGAPVAELIRRSIKKYLEQKINPCYVKKYDNTATKSRS
jgi:predicted DNA-binding protein